MIFIGFGFLMTFIKFHSWSAVGFNLLIATWSIQISILFISFWAGAFHGFEQIELTVESLIKGDFAAGAVLIAFGAVLGKVNVIMLFIMAISQLFFYTLNEEIGVGVFHASDAGGSMYVHTFGALFGVGCAWMYRPKGYKEVPNSSYYNMLFSTIGSIFLWMYWPSFNGALASGNS